MKTNPAPSVVDTAFVIASVAHAGQVYGDNGTPYVDHLAAVVDVLGAFTGDDDLIAAAWLHDAVEDTTITTSDIEAACGSRVSNLVWACSGVGRNRETRNAAIQAKISAYPPAAIVKLADRIANVEQSAAASSHRAMYLAENEAFEALVRQHVPEAMWERLEKAFVQ